MVTRQQQFCCIFALTKDKFDYFLKKLFHSSTLHTYHHNSSLFLNKHKNIHANMSCSVLSSKSELGKNCKFSVWVLCICLIFSSDRWRPLKKEAWFCKKKAHQHLWVTVPPNLKKIEIFQLDFYLKVVSSLTLREGLSREVFRHDFEKQ